MSPKPQEHNSHDDQMLHSQNKPNRKTAAVGADVGQNPSTPPDAGVKPPGRPARSRMQASRDGLSQTVAAAVDLLQEGDRAHAGISTDARDLLLDEIESDPGQPRRHFDDADLRALADDIVRRGVLQPILVRPPLTPGAPYRLVAGERRWRAAHLAGRVRIPARVRELADEEVQAAQLAENILRAGLTDIEKGRALRRLYELRKTQNYKITWEDIAAEVGLGRARIHDLFNLASLAEPVAALIESGQLSGSHGIALQRAQDTLPEADVLALAQQAARPASKRVGGYNLSVARLRLLIQSRIGASNGSPEPGGTQVSGHPAVIRRNEDAPQSTSTAIEPIRAFVRKTLEAIAGGDLTSAERQELVEALGQPGQDRHAKT